MKTKISFKDCQMRIDERGFSLIEMMVAMVIFLIVTGSIYGLLRVGSIDRSRTNNRADVLQNARVAIQLIGRDAFNAGLEFNRTGAVVPDNFIANTFNLPPDTDTERDRLTAIITGNNRNGNQLLADPGAKTDVIGFCYRDRGFNGGNTIGLAKADPHGGSTARAETVQANGAANSGVHDLYLLESDRSQLAVMVSATDNVKRLDFSPTDPLNLNQAMNGSAANRSLLRKCTGSETDCYDFGTSVLTKFNMVSYKVSDNGTLVRTVYGNNTGRPATEQKVEYYLAYNVEDLQITYVLEDGTVTENPTVGPNGIPGTSDDEPLMNNKIRQINVVVKVQATESDQQTSQPVSVTLRATFATRNLEYDVK